LTRPEPTVGGDGAEDEDDDDAGDDADDDAKSRITTTRPWGLMPAAGLKVIDIEHLSDGSAVQLTPLLGSVPGASLAARHRVEISLDLRRDDLVPHVVEVVREAIAGIRVLRTGP